MNTKKAFTLVEIGIIVLILGIMTVAFIPKFLAKQAKTRDVERKESIRKIANALELYLTDQGIYPQPYDRNTNTYGEFNTASSGEVANLSGFLKNTPTDPKTKKHYIYANVFNPANTDTEYRGGDGNTFPAPKVWTYDLWTILENPLDPDRAEVQKYRYMNDKYSILSHATLIQENVRIIYDYSPNVKNRD